MKRTLSILVLVILMASMLVPTMASAMANPNTRFVKTGNGKPLNVRSDPSSNAHIETQLPYRTQVNVLETHGSWCLIMPCDIMWSNPMWVMKSFLVTKDPGPYTGKDPSAGPTYEDVDAAVRLLKPVETPYLAEIITERPNNYVHLRWIPNTSARYSAQYLAGEKLLVLAESKYWAQVMTLRDGYVGFILKKNVNAMQELNAEMMQGMQDLLSAFETLENEAEAVGAAQ